MQQSSDVILRNMSNFPSCFSKFQILILVLSRKQNLEKSQQDLAEKISQILQKAKSIVLGGGHEVTFAHYSGIKNHFKPKNSIINIDAHFDNREPENEVERLLELVLANWRKEGKFILFLIRFRKIPNTLKLFDTAHQFGMKYILATEIFL